MNELLKPFNFKCERCFNTGIWMNPRNKVEYCPAMMTEGHPAVNEASLLLHRAVENLAGRSVWIHPRHFDAARILTNFTSENPCSRQLIIDYFFAEMALSNDNKLRKFHSLIETLREFWLLPVASRKTEPFGYWISADLEDFKEWMRRATVAPKTQLTTLWHVARANFAVLAGQSEFEFLNNIEEEKADAK